MRDSLAVAVILFCVHRRWAVIGAAAVVFIAAVLYTLGHLAIDTDVERLFSSNTPWVEHQLAYERQFPEHQIIAVVTAPTPERVEIASMRLVAALQQRHDVIKSATDPEGGTFAARNQLLFTPPRELGAVLAGLQQSAPALKLLAADPSLRGAMQALEMGADAVAAGRLPADGLDRPMNELSDLLDEAFAGRPASISWRGPMSASPPAPVSNGPSRHFIEVDPKLEFDALQPGRAAAEAIKGAAAQLHLRSRNGANLQLTGQVPLDDAQFSTLSASAIPELLGTIAAVLAILFLALRSARVILAVFLTLAVGLAATAAVGLLEVGSFNLISVAFAILFVGLGADFAIQFSVRYRAERYEAGEAVAALRRTAEKAGGPLALAAAGTTVGFFCFLPTDYRGVGELGAIAGTGMLIAFAVTMTLLPALLFTLGTPAERRPMGFRSLAPIDRFLSRHRAAVVAATIAVVLAGTALLPLIRFDFDPTRLLSQNSPAVKTYRELSGVPQIGLNAVNIVTPSVDRLPGVLRSLNRLPEVAGTRSVLDLIPSGQPAKLLQIRAVAAHLLPDLYPKTTKPPPTDDARIADIRAAAAALQRLKPPPNSTAAADIERLVPRLDRLAASSLAMRDRVEDALMLPLRHDLDRLRAMLDPEVVTLQSLPPEMKREWLAPNGAARAEVLPKGNLSDPHTMRRFARTVLAVDPDAVGSPIELYQAQRTVISAFVEAGVLAIVAIGVILWIALRRIGDVLLTLVPLLVAGLVTLELMALFGLPLNFANVIALPLLLGVGVAFKIYYVMAWRRGRTNLLQSTLTRAVFFSALTTATAFGSLWLSSDPGMSSMGQLMALALVCTLSAAVLFQPALMGPPRKPATTVANDSGAHEPAALAAPEPRPAHEPERVD